MNEIIFHNHDDAMLYAISLAKKGRGFVEPNPCVGAILVDGRGKLISQGYHQNFGGPHAEVHALELLDSAPEDSTLYVTLEPCNHFGKTPPCTELLIRKNVKNVVIGCVDPAPHVQGQGIEKLKQAGINIYLGCCELQAKELIAPFVTFHLKHRPYIHAKWAMTLDGKIATSTGHSRWITNEQSRQYVHELRSKMDAILTGAGTVLADDPMLTARTINPAKNASRIVLDHQARTPVQSQLVQSARDVPVLIFASEKADEGRCKVLQLHGVEIIRMPAADRVEEVHLVLKILAERKITHLFLEAGEEIIGSFFDAEVIDEIHMFLAPKIIGGKASKSPIGGTGLGNIPELPNCRIVEQIQFADNIYIRSRMNANR